MGVLQRGGDGDGGPFARVGRGVGQQVVQDLRDPPPVGPHQRQARSGVDVDAVPVPAAEEGTLGQVDDRRQVGRLGGHRQGSSLDAGHVQQVVDQVSHVVGLVLDEAEELADFGRIQRHRRVPHRGRGALDRCERRPELVAHHRQELAPQPLEILQRRHVLQRGHHRHQLAVLGADRRGVDQGGHGGAVTALDHQFLSLHGLAVADRPHHRQLVVGDLGSVQAPAGEPPHILRRVACLRRRRADDASRLAVGHHHRARTDVHHQHPHRRRVDQSLEVGLGPLLIAVAAGVGDRHRRLCGEHRQGLLVLLGEHRVVVLLTDEDRSHMAVPHLDLGRQERPYVGPEPREALRLQMGHEVRGPQRLAGVSQVREQLPAPVVAHHFLLLSGGQSRQHQVLQPSGIVKGGDRAVAGPR